MQSAFERHAVAVPKGPLRPAWKTSATSEGGAVQVAILIPCFNEEGAIGAVVGSFREALPNARIYVYDNNSEDRTAALGGVAGAIVRHEQMQGKGNVCRCRRRCLRPGRWRWHLRR
jgi:hypothetical protein